MPTRLFFTVGLLLTCFWPARAQEPTVVELQVTPQPVNQDSTALRLLPAAPELKDGNAAVVMLRSIWEQQAFLRHDWPQLDELMELPYDDPQITEEFSFGQFQRKLRRAAYIQDADWNYPMDEQLLAEILLPDVQGLRHLAGRGMSLWIGQQIAKGDLDEARVGLLVQLACARHLARTPFRVTHLVAYAMADLSLDKTELLLQQPESPNLYWALAKLPGALGDTQAMLQWEAEMVPRSLPTLRPEPPAIGDPRWPQVMKNFVHFMDVDEADLQGTSKERLSVAREAVSEQFAEAQLAEMSDEEVVMRWILHANDRLYVQTEAAFTLPPREAIAKLQQIKERVQELTKRAGIPPSPFFSSPIPDDPVETYLNLHRFDRRVNFLQVVEAIRDHAARNNRELPETLGDITLHVPDDPLTGEPFHYTLEGDQATLAMPLIDGIDTSIQKRRVYEIRLAQ